MPNWACANYVASGDRVELEELVRTLNTMPNLLPDTPSGFGRYWLGNLFGAFGMTLEPYIPASIHNEAMLSGAWTSIAQ